MYSRLNQLARHFSRPLPNYLHNSAARSGLLATTSSTMADSNGKSGKRMINTAACLIIGDEVLGGKVSKSCVHIIPLASQLSAETHVDGRYQ